MSARSSTGARPAAGRGGEPASDGTPGGAEVPVVGQREPCPCGSGKRYKQCHGLQRRAAASAVVLRPYRGLPGEPDWVALRELVPAATATARVGSGPSAGTAVRVASALPDGVAAVRREDGEVLVSLQQRAGSGDASGEAGAALAAALAAPPGEQVAAGAGGAGPRLQELLDASAPFEVTVHDGFDFWLDRDGEGADEQVRAALDEAAGSLVPSVRLAGVGAAYWAQVGTRRHLRWVLPEDEQPLLDALARLHVAGALTVGGGSRYLGAFRAQGLLVPVWDLTADTGAEQLEEPAALLRQRLDEALATTAPLGDAERRARAGVVSRQVTLR